MAKQKTIIVGAGPVGSLAALYAAGRGDDVEIYELRGDLRDPSTVPLNFTKSINLALSERGINSMRNANCPGLLDAVLAETIPMHGRMIHGTDKLGAIFQESQAYDVHGRYIRAVDRAGLNKRLLDELEKLPNVTFHFNHKLIGADFKKRIAWFELKPPSAVSDHAQNPTQQTKKDDQMWHSHKAPKGDSPSKGGDKMWHAQDKPSDQAALPENKEKEVAFDFMIGADGAHSAVRYHLMKYTRMDYSQEYIDSLWCEFHIDKKTGSSASVDKDAAANDDGDFKMSPNHLHIWPGGDKKMFIAIPSLDKTFTCTLFLNEAAFQAIDKQNDPKTAVPAFFKKEFPGVVPDLISEEDIVKQYTSNPHLPLISIKCGPYHYDSSVVILGDAAHAMVPFYGQGMNAGLEDVRTLYEHLDAHLSSSQSSSSSPPADLTFARRKALTAYTAQRHPDALAINDLALRNYQEMSSDVRSPIYLLRKHIEEFLNARLPNLGWATQYSRVSFGNDRYSEVQSRADKQKRVLTNIIGAVGGAVGLFALWGFSRWRDASRGLGGLGLRFEAFDRRFI